MMLSRWRAAGHGLWCAALLVAVLLGGCDDDPARPDADLVGRVTHPDGSAAADAPVYLATTPLYFPGNAPVVGDSTRTDADGWFALDRTTDDPWQVYAGVWNQAGTDFTEVSPFDLGIIPAVTGFPQELTLFLMAVNAAGTVNGQAVYNDGETDFPAAGARIVLYRYLGGGLVAEAETVADVAGAWSATPVRTGNYTAWASLTLDAKAPLPLEVTAETDAFFCDGLQPVPAPLLRLSEVLVRKPAVYLYPARPGPHQVRLELADAVRLTRSIPEYGDGWDVDVAADGRIDDRWDYLFYEVALAGTPALERGWCLEGAELAEGLERVVRALGLNDAECADFLDYWLALLPRRPFWLVRPLLDADLDPLARLRVDPAPDSARRFWLFFQGSDHRRELPAPEIAPFRRQGGVVVEWGGAIVPGRPGT